MPTNPTIQQPMFKVATYRVSSLKPLEFPKQFKNTNPLYANVKSRVNSWREKGDKGSNV